MLEADEMKAFFNRCVRAGSGDMIRQFALFLEGTGLEFLRIVEDEIIRRKVMDTRLLLSSFQKGGKENVWELTENGLTLEIGTNVEYAKEANYGHWTCKKGEAMRFVPGYWSGDRFVYDKSAKTGMMLKQKWVEGAHYWESAIRIMERALPELMERKLEKWLEEYFGGE